MRNDQMQRLMELVNNTKTEDIPELMRAMFDMYFMSMVKVAETIGERYQMENLACKVAKLMMDVSKRAKSKAALTN